MKTAMRAPSTVPASAVPTTNPMTQNIQAYQRIKSKPLPSSTKNSIGPGYREAIESHYSKPHTLQALKEADKEIWKKFKGILTADHIGWNEDRGNQLNDLCNRLYTAAAQKIPQRMLADKWPETCLTTLLKLQNARQAGAAYGNLMTQVRKQLPLDQHNNAIAILNRANNFASLVQKASRSLAKPGTQTLLYRVMDDVEQEVFGIIQEPHAAVFQRHWDSRWQRILDPAFASVNKVQEEREKKLLQRCCQSLGQARSLQTLDQAYKACIDEASRFASDFPFASVLDILGLYKEARQRRYPKAAAAADLADAARWSEETLKVWRNQCSNTLQLAPDYDYIQIVSPLLRSQLEQMTQWYPTVKGLRQRGEQWLFNEVDRIRSGLPRPTQKKSTMPRRSYSLIIDMQKRNRLRSASSLRRQFDTFKSGLHQYPVVEATEQAPRQKQPWPADSIPPPVDPYAYDPDSDRGRNMKRTRDHYDAVWAM